MHALCCGQKEKKKSMEWKKILIMNITNKELANEILKYNKTKAN